ncbi:MAG: hypothetical protein RPU14_03100 [Candidatus Sedimenticola sp. (ex Thyasira tokunagai)]
MDELERIKQIYESHKKALGYAYIPKEERDALRKKWKAQIKSARKASERLLELIPTLPMEDFYDLDDGGNRDFSLLSTMEDNLNRMTFCLDQYEIPKGKNAHGWAEDKLVMNLARICEKPITCHWDAERDCYVGNFVTFLEKNLPEVGINQKKKVAAFAQRYIRLTKK